MKERKNTTIDSLEIGYEELETLFLQKDVKKKWNECTKKSTFKTKMRDFLDDVPGFLDQLEDYYGYHGDELKARNRKNVENDILMNIMIGYIEDAYEEAIVNGVKPEEVLCKLITEESILTKLTNEINVFYFAQDQIIYCLASQDEKSCEKATT